MDYYALSESQTIELKEASDHLPLSLFETYSSFANTEGGIIYLGIKEKKPKNIIVGVNNAPMLKKSFFDSIHNKTKVSCAIVDDTMWREIEIDGKTIIEIRVNEAPISLKPVYLNGNPAFTYLRRADGDYMASVFERRAMELDAVPQKFDMRPNPFGYGLLNLNKETLASYRAVFNARNPENLYMADSDEEFFHHIGALRENENGVLVATNAAVLLFGTYPMIKDCFPEFDLDYREISNDEFRWDYRLDASSFTWSGNAFDFYQSVIAHVKPKLPNHFHLSGVYEDGGKILLECIRECLTNAIANCDYLLHGGVKVIYTPNKMVFENAGRLRLSVKQMIVGGCSDPRNEGIMNLLHIAGIGDKAGEGIPNVFRRMRALKFPDPIIEQSSAPFKSSISIFFDAFGVEETETIDTKIIHYLSKVESSNVTSIASALSINPATISIALKRLTERGLVIDNGKKTKGKLFKINQR